MKYKLFILGTFLIGFWLNAMSQNNPAGGYSVSLYSSNVNCFGGSNGSVTASVNNGIGPFTFKWSTGQNNNSTSSTNTLNNLEAGIYSVNVIDNGSGLTAYGMATVTEPQPISSKLSATDVKCKGEQTGAIVLNVSGGTGSFNYLWSNNSPVKNQYNLKAGKYIVTIKENSNPNCYIQDSIEIKEPTFALNYNYVKEDVKCFNGQNALIDLSVYGGTPPYTYDWNNGQFNTEDISKLTASNYKFSVYDANNCHISDSVEITQPTLITNNLTGKDVKCFGAKSGEIANTVSGGTPPYSYEWWNSTYKLSFETKDLANIVADQYKVKVTDANNCSTSDSVVISTPTQLFSKISSTDISAYGGTDGAINLTVSGGTKPYSFIWSNGASTEDQMNLGAGKYVVDIIDFNSCSISDSIVLNEPLSALSLQKYSENVSCFGGQNAWAEIYVNGGTQPYHYKWATGDTVPKIYNLSAGSYAVLVTDYNGISVTDSITIEEPTAISANASVVSNKCFGENKGKIDLTVSGGTSPYTYEWRNSDYVLSAKTQDVQNLIADKYTVTVFDSNHCQSSFTFQITEPTIVQINTKATDAPCFGGPNGKIEIEVSGGTTPYNFSWASGEKTEDLLNAYPGRNTVTVTDANGCVYEASDSVGKMDSIEFDYLTTDATCTDRQDGSAKVLNVKGGNGNYSYLWSNGDTINETFGLEEGTISIIISDFLGCSKSKEIYIEEINTECINIPNAFTPNGDGTNDTWVLRNIDFYPNCVVKVFNRWGKVVFESPIGYPDEWDGTYNGQPLPSGTYYYIFESNKKLAPKNGMVTIVR